ncbi:MAG: hypothetical protein KAQ98_06780 [Bacteriovoracaceae bacterium]|nr:hypothetical protein [Bacteriovoracaceae bacterium]
MKTEIAYFRETVTRVALFGIPCYGSLLTGLYLALDKHPFVVKSGIISMVIYLLISLILTSKNARNSKIWLNIVAISLTLFTPISVIGVCVKFDFQIIGVIWSLMILVAVLDVIWILSEKFLAVASIVLVCMLSSVVYVALGDKMSTGFVVTWIALMFWKYVNIYFNVRLKLNLFELKKLEAFKATVITLKHEFNNVGAVIAGIKEVDKKKHELPKEMLPLFYVSVERLLDLINKIGEKDDYHEEKYVKDISMLSLNKKK